MQPQPLSRIAPFVADLAAYVDVAPPSVFALPCLPIRRLGQDDRAALAAHFLALPQQHRRSRCLIPLTAPH